MKPIIISSILSALMAGGLASAAVLPRSTDQLTCSYDSTHDLKWTSLQDHNQWGYLSFSNRKDSQGRAIATTLEKNGKPAEPVRFDFVTCAAPSGKPGYMGYGSGKMRNGKHVGHFQLKSNPKMCLAAESIKDESYLVLEPCSFDDSKVQQYQFFSPAINYIYAGIVRNPLTSDSMIEGTFFVDEKDAGKPFKMAFSTSPSKFGLYWKNRPSA